MKVRKIYDLPFFGKRYLSYKVTKEGGQMHSSTLRNIYKKKYRTLVGKESYGGMFSPFFNIGGNTIIGRYSSIAKDVHYFGANHPINFASTSPYFYNKKYGFDVQDVPRETLRIGHDVWIGYGVIILSSCKSIGNGAIIGAGAVVTKDIPPYCIAVGNPCCIIRKRFDEETIHKLEESKWYNLEPNQLFEFYEYIGSPKEFAEKIIDNSKKNNTDLGSKLNDC